MHGSVWLQTLMYELFALIDNHNCLTLYWAHGEGR